MFQLRQSRVYPKGPLGMSPPYPPKKTEVSLSDSLDANLCPAIGITYARRVVSILHT